MFLRFAAGPLCDQFGPRRVYATLMLLGCLTVGLAPLVNNITGLYISRSFIGVLGATFVPCQVWCTVFFDKNVVGTANALAGGWGTAGVGIAYLVMPAVFDSLVSRQRMSESQAWRVTFVAPLLCLAVCALGMLLLCPDAPAGSRQAGVRRVQDIAGANGPHGVSVAGARGVMTGGAPPDEERGISSDEDAHASCQKHRAPAWRDIGTAVRLSFKDALPVVLSLQTVFHVATYSCSAGGELAVSAVLASYFKANYSSLGQTEASHLASISGFLNFAARPLGGAVADVLYNWFGRKLWLKKAWITCCGVTAGALLIAIGRVNPSEQKGQSVGTMVGLVSVAAMFLEAGSGANFALVPHVHPSANGIVSGLTGGCGNLGGIVFATVFRFTSGGAGYCTAFSVIGAVQIALNLAVSGIAPLPPGQ